MWDWICRHILPYGGVGTTMADNRLTRMIRKLKSLFKRGDK